jgi:hypothetical protein
MAIFLRRMRAYATAEYNKEVAGILGILNDFHLLVQNKAKLEISTAGFEGRRRGASVIVSYLGANHNVSNDVFNTSHQYLTQEDNRLDSVD